MDPAFKAGFVLQSIAPCQISHPRLGVSTWSLNKSLTAGTPLLDIPAQVAAHGLGKLEVCHFHFPSTEPGYLAEFRAAVEAAGIEFYTLLIDEGDLTSPDPGGAGARPGFDRALD